MSETKNLTPEAAADPLMNPTNEYAMRHAANLLSNFARAHAHLSAGDIEVLNFAYQQLHRGANTLRAALEASE